MIDSHQHLLYREHFSYPWPKEIPALEEIFPFEENGAAAAGTEISGTIFMEVDAQPSQNIQEARFFCQLAQNPGNQLYGEIAAAHPEDAHFGDVLDAIIKSEARAYASAIFSGDALEINKLQGVN